MGSGNHGGFGTTKGSKKSKSMPMKMNLQFFATKVFGPGGNISEESFEGHREFFLGKSVRKIQKEMKKHGYITHIEPSTHPKSKAKMIVVDNNTKNRNVTMIEVTPGSKRHGDVAYVRISTNNIGKLKIVANKEEYKPGKKEKAKIYFARRTKKR